VTKPFNLCSSIVRGVSFLSLVGCATLVACGSDNPSTSNPVAGAPGVSHAGAPSSSAGSPATAGSNGGMVGSAAGSGGSGAGQNQAGASGASPVSGGAPSTAGGASGGAGNGAGSGGRSGAAGGGTAGGGTAGGGTAGGGSAGSGGKEPARPSTGCDKANPQTGTSGSPLTVSGHQYYVKLPTGYVASKAYPVIMVFNPTGNPITWAEQSAGFEMTGPKEAWIRVYPTMAVNANGWGANDVAFFAPFYEQIISSYCVDKARVFATGESSGGDFSSILGCEYGDKIRATAPAATKPVNGYGLDVPIKRQCKGEVTAVVIHGKNDNVVGPANGPKTRDFYAALNHCGTTTTPVPDYTNTLSNCVMYQGCDAGFPVYWCNHTDPNYSNTNHGWPAFANKFLYSLFSSL